MRISSPPPGMAVHGAGLACALAGGRHPAGAGAGLAPTAWGMVLLHEAMPGHSGQPAHVLALRARVAQALEGAPAGAGPHPVRIAVSGRAGSLARLFAGEHACP